MKVGVNPPIHEATIIPKISAGGTNQREAFEFQITGILEKIASTVLQLNQLMTGQYVDMKTVFTI